jgi:hypothetical protein
MVRNIMMATMLITILLTAILYAEETKTAPVAETPSKAVLTIDEPRFDFGIVPPRSRVTKIYTLRSTGEEALLIENVRATCGCTAATPDKTELEPGESTSLRVTYRASSRVGSKANKSVRVTTNDAQRKVQNLSFSAFQDTIYPIIKPEPVEIDLGTGEEMQNKTTFELTNVADDNFEISLISFDSENIGTVDIKDKKLKPGESTVVTVTMRDDLDDNKRIEASVTLETNDIGKTRFSVPITGSTVQARPRHPKSTPVRAKPRER